MNLIEKFHRKVGVLVKGDVWNMDLPEVKYETKKEKGI